MVDDHMVYHDIGINHSIPYDEKPLITILTLYS